MAYQTSDSVWRVEATSTSAGPAYEIRERGILRMVARTPESLALWLRVLAGVGLEQLVEG